MKNAETNCRIAHNLGILLMSSNCFAIFFSSILVMTVQISIQSWSRKTFAFCFQKMPVPENDVHNAHTPTSCSSDGSSHFDQQKDRLEYLDVNFKYPSVMRVLHEHDITFNHIVFLVSIIFVPEILAFYLVAWSKRLIRWIYSF